MSKLNESNWTVNPHKIYVYIHVQRWNVWELFKCVNSIIDLAETINNVVNYLRVCMTHTISIKNNPKKK